jgi:FkbM family methyltransferase
MLDESWEPSTMNYLTSIRGKLFVDVGANLGVYCAKLQKNFERTIAIEADPIFYEKLSKRAPINCKAINLAVSNIEGAVNFYAATDLGEEDFNPGLGTLFPPISQEWNRKLNRKPASNMIEVRAAPLSRILANEGDIDLVKVDVEGAEWLVLEGAEPIMKRIKNWVIELHQLSRKHELEARMKGYGYEGVEWLDTDHAAFHKSEANVAN